MSSSVSSFIQSGSSSVLLFSNLNYDSELINYDPRFNRNFDEMVSERIDTHGFYTNVFETIKNKLYTISDTEPNLSEVKKIEYEHKYQFGHFNNLTDILKKTIVEFYQNKIKIEQEFETNKIKYENFSKNILQTIIAINDVNGVNNVNNVNGTLSEQDTHFKDILIERINWYYTELNLENLKNQCDELNNEFIYIKSFMLQLSSMTNNIICQICQENQITHFIDPCGHTICGICKDRSDRMIHCHFCRAKTNSYKKLFF